MYVAPTLFVSVQPAASGGLNEPLSLQELGVTDNRIRPGPPDPPAPPVANSLPSPPTPPVAETVADDVTVIVGAAR